MKNLTTYLTAFLCLTMLSLDAQELELRRWVFQNNFTDANFNVCGAPENMTFRVNYDQCPDTPNDCVRACGRNPYRTTVWLFRNGREIATQAYLTSTPEIIVDFNNILGSPGDYRARVRFERRRGILCTGWETMFEGWTNDIDGVDVAASPDFNVSGFFIPGSNPITVCASDVRVNAAATSCETRYYIGVEECDQWWSRTFEYEWGLWFTGEAPNNINLQNLAATYSYPPHFNGLADRQGDILFGGTLSNGLDRYYRVKLCTNEPNWLCTTALVKIDGNCFGGSGPEDTNVYIIWEEEEESDVAELAPVSGEKAVPNESLDGINLSNDPQIALPTERSALQIAPNPFHDYTTITIPDYNGEETVVFELFNGLGEQVRRVKTEDAQFEFSRDGLAPGVYYYRARSAAGSNWSGKLMIQ